MSYTPYINLTDREFSTLLANIELPTDTEIEAMERIDKLLHQIDDLEAELEDVGYGVVCGVVDPFAEEALS